MEDYRAKFQRHYGIFVDGHKYQIHHIDFNRNNNSITNLMILPTELHKKYHLAVDNVSMFSKSAQGTSKYKFEFDCRISSNRVCYLSEQHEAFFTLAHILNQCAKWGDYKLFLDGVIGNVHGITLE